MIVGQILEGALAGRKLILEPRKNLRPNEYLIEDGVFMNGAPTFSLHCLVHDMKIPNTGCPLCGDK